MKKYLLLFACLLSLQLQAQYHVPKKTILKTNVLNLIGGLPSLHIEQQVGKKNMSIIASVYKGTINILGVTSYSGIGVMGRWYLQPNVEARCKGAYASAGINFHLENTAGNQTFLTNGILYTGPRADGGYQYLSKNEKFVMDFGGGLFLAKSQTSTELNARVMLGIGYLISKNNN